MRLVVTLLQDNRPENPTVLRRSCPSLLRAAAVVALALPLLMGCKEDKAPGPKDAAPAPTVPPAAVEKKKLPAPLALGHRFPVGPQLVFLPGKGVGAIRFGATVETIERHMEAPCDLKTESRCLYVRAAVEFFIKDGILERVKAHRRDRKVENAPKDGDQYYGSLAGIVQPKIMMGLHEHIVLEEFGEPRKKEKLDAPGPDGLVSKFFYDGIVFEFDKIDNGNIVLSGIEVTPSETPYVPPPAAGEIVPPPPGKAPQADEQRAR